MRFPHMLSEKILDRSNCAYRLSRRQQQLNFVRITWPVLFTLRRTVWIRGASRK